MNIPSSDGFRPRPAYLYLPPAAVRDPRLHLPVLELLHGTPGAPSNWSTPRGMMVTTADAFAEGHHGQAPIVVMPDSNGAYLADSQCIRTKTGQNTESYLTSDVVAWIRRRFRAAVGTEKWWLAGLSEGGVCSLMLALRHPDLYSAFGDFSGLARPLVDHLTVAESDRQLYGASVVSRLEHDPIWLLTHRRYPHLRGWFECGASDRTVLADQKQVVALATDHHIPVRASVLPGGHSWTVWSAALRSLLPWLWAQWAPAAR